MHNNGLWQAGRGVQGQDEEGKDRLHLYRPGSRVLPSHARCNIPTVPVCAYLCVCVCVCVCVRVRVRVRVCVCVDERKQKVMFVIRIVRKIALLRLPMSERK